MPSHVMTYDSQPSVEMPLLWKQLKCTNGCLHKETAAAENARNSFIFPVLGGFVLGLAELLPLVSIMFVCRHRWAEAVAARPEDAWSRGRCGPEASQLIVVWTFPLTLSCIILFYFSPWTEAMGSYSHYCVLQGPEQHSNDVPNLISALQPPAGQ